MLSRRRFAVAAAAGGPALLARTARGEAAAEPTIDRVRKSKVLRIAALTGEAPYFDKDAATGAWIGMCVEMARDIAGFFDAKLEYLESTFDNSVIDLQADKIDLAFALNPTPKRALVIDFTHAFLPYGIGRVGKTGFTVTSWPDLDKPEVKIAVDIGSVHELAARRRAPQATIIGFKTRDEALLAVQSGRTDCAILGVAVGLVAVRKNPVLGEFRMLDTPRVELPTCIGVRRNGDTRWRDFLNAWVDFNRGIQQFREWLIGGLALSGVKPEDVPPGVEL